MNRLQGTLQTQGLAQLPQGQVVLLGEQRADLTTVGGQDHGFASGQPMARSNVTCAATLLEELLDHPHRDAETMGNLSPGAFIVVVGIEDALAEIQGERAHAQNTIRVL